MKGTLRSIHQGKIYAKFIKDVERTPKVHLQILMRCILNYKEMIRYIDFPTHEESIKVLY